MSTQKLSGKVAGVTAASNGMGAACVTRVRAGTDHRPIALGDSPGVPRRADDHLALLLPRPEGEPHLYAKD